MDIIKAFRELSYLDKERTMLELGSEWESHRGLMSEISLQLEQSRPGSMPCPHCNSAKTIRRGVVKGVEQFSCNECKKNFRGSYGTALFRIRRKDKWQGYLRLMEQGYSIKKAAAELGISIQTSFDWRHKILASLQITLPIQVGGIVECDELQLTKSEKGKRNLDRKPRKRGSDGHTHISGKVNVITAVSRNKGLVTAVVASKKIDGKEAVEALNGRLEADTVLVTDENRAYNAVKRENQNITHVKINSKKNRTEKPKNKLHLQTVGNQHKQIRDFMGPFNGVATKYLPNYLNWFNYRQSQKDNKEKVKSMMVTCLSETSAIPFFIEIAKNAY
jgi:transposase-like protein